MSFSDLYTILTWLSNKIKTQASHTVFTGSFLIWSLCPRSHLPLPSLQHTVIQTNWFSLCCPNPWDLFYVEAFALPVLSSWLPLSCTLTLWASPSASISVQTSEDIFQSQWWPSNLVQAFNLIHLFISLCFVFCKQVSLSHVISFIRFHLLSFSIIAQRQHEFKRNKTSLHGAWGDGSVDNNTHSADMRIWVWTPSTHRKSLACMTTHAYGSSTAG